MTAKEKADELWRNLVETVGLNQTDAVECAIIAVDGIISTLYHFGYLGAMYDDFETGRIITTDEKLPEVFWNEVKNELNNVS